MNTEAASFLIDRLDLARLAITEARQTLEKFAEDEDAETARILGEILERIELLDVRIKSSSYSV